MLVGDVLGLQSSQGIGNGESGNSQQSPAVPGSIMVIKPMLQKPQVTGSC